jgi:hypothetical protein
MSKKTVSEKKPASPATVPRPTVFELASLAATIAPEAFNPLQTAPLAPDRKLALQNNAIEAAMRLWVRTAEFLAGLPESNDELLASYSQDYLTTRLKAKLKAVMPGHAIAFNPKAPSDEARDYLAARGLQFKTLKPLKARLTALGELCGVPQLYHACVEQRAIPQSVLDRIVREYHEHRRATKLRSKQRSQRKSSVA